MSNSLGPDQARRPNLGTNCLQKLYGEQLTIRMLGNFPLKTVAFKN